jgi:ribulose-5-phosphate 4-epimerase/fuculose-1-phosphate aldolase
MAKKQMIGTAEDDRIQQVKVDLAACLRMAVLDDFHEGIDNHFTVVVPGRTDRYFVLPFGRHWSEARASDLIVFNEAGETLEGSGVVELTAQCIHAPLHRVSGKNVVLHTHQNWALTLNMLADNRLRYTSQTAAFFYNQIAYDDDYQGLACSVEEGERLAACLGNKSILFMKNHGIVVTGDNIAQAYRRMYKLERVCRAQILAMSTGQALAELSQLVIDRVITPSPNDRHPKALREYLYFEAVKRIVDRELPGYAD